MARHPDQKASEHAKYAEEHSLKRSHQEEVSELKDKIALLETELKLYRNK